jgi:hypothetical protein
MLFSKNREQEGKTGWQREWGGRFKERVWEGECSGNTMYSCMKMEK